MPRIPYLNEADISVNPDFLQAVKQRRPNGQLLNLDRILFYSEPVIRGWQALLSQLRQKLHFSGKLRELVILRIAIVNHAPYEFIQHTPEAIKEGITQIELDALVNWEDSISFDEMERAVLAYSDAMTILVQVPDSIYKKLSIHFNNQQIVELTTLIGGYNMVSRFLEALQISTDGEYAISK